jgi:hypothetical protein
MLPLYNDLIFLLSEREMGLLPKLFIIYQGQEFE